MPNIIKSRNAETFQYNAFRNNLFEELNAEDFSDKSVNNADEVLFDESGLFPDDGSDFPAADVSVEPIVQEPPFDMEEFLEKVRTQAEELSKELMDKARCEAEQSSLEMRMRAQQEGQEQGYKEGYNEGYEKGYVEAYEKGLKEVSHECDRLLCEIQAGMELFKEEKKKLEEKNLEGMKTLSLSIAEKVIAMNLESQSDVIKQMIISALDNSKSTQWVKIYISGFDSQRYFEIEKELLESIRHISEFVKVEVVDGAEAGTCIIEMPDKIIDASVTTQIDNIKNMLDN